MQILHSVDEIFTGEEVYQEKPQIRTKFNISMEKKIERLWHESERHGWNFSKFVTVVLEVLTVLHHRKKLQHIERAPKRASHRKRPLS
jgi:hypothetical protein